MQNSEFRMQNSITYKHTPSFEHLVVGICHCCSIIPFAEELPAWTQTHTDRHHSANYIKIITFLTSAFCVLPLATKVFLNAKMRKIHTCITGCGGYLLYNKMLVY